MTVTIAGLEMTTGLWRMTWDRETATRTYDYSAAVEPRKVEAGKLVPLTAAEESLLALEGFDGDLSAQVVHQDLPNGGGPDAATIAQEQLAALTSAYMAVYGAWVGHTVSTANEAPA